MDDVGMGGGERRQSNAAVLITIGHVLRGLALLGKGSDAEATFARVAIMPVVWSRLNVGPIDMGGSRGECAGLFFLLAEIANTVQEMYGPTLDSARGCLHVMRMSMR